MTKGQDNSIGKGWLPIEVWSHLETVASRLPVEAEDFNYHKVPMAHFFTEYLQYKNRPLAAWRDVERNPIG
jgi:hypothetical protein